MFFTLTVQTLRLSLLEHIAIMNDAKKILTAYRPTDWKRPPGCLRTTRMNTVQDVDELQVPQSYID